ncbi:MAG: hypothetical protein B7Z10_02235 [Rhodobacterales bacterium 32-66-7]|nr:MAG: hypothetical protein B7Z10_02235 [Rhodobacterales bacterium 32-66-7]
MVRKLFVSLFLLGFFANFSAATAEIKLYSRVVEIRKYSDERLTADVSRGYVEWSRDKNYYGAIAVNVEEDAYSYWSGLHSLDSVVKYVIADCEGIAKKPCKLYAVMVPKDFPKNTLKGGGLSLVATKEFKNYLSDHVKGKHSAFAISGIGTFGFSWEYDSKEEAVSAASYQCEGYTDIDLAGFDKAQRDMAQDLGLTTCKIIDTRN